MTHSLDTTDLIAAISDHLTASYVFPDRSAQAVALLGSRLERGDYGPPSQELCEAVSADLFATTDDKHLRLIWHDNVEASQDEAALVAAVRNLIRSENNGVRRVERLSDNVGLIELTIIPEAATGGETLNAAMTLVQHTDALILDLRATRGGSPDGVALLASYLFTDEGTRLSDFIEGPDGPVRQYWTAGYLPGPRYVNRHVFVLTSSDTFSGGEALAYDLQALQRATIVGEPTRGGAHPSEVISLADHVELRLPVARAVNPITGTNWESVGVQPDIATTADAALQTARQLALTSTAP